MCIDLKRNRNILEFFHCKMWFALLHSANKMDELLLFSFSYDFRFVIIAVNLLTHDLFAY